MNKFDLYEVNQGHYQISTDRKRLELDVIHGYLERSYWSPGVPKESVEKAIMHSLCFGVYDISRHVGQVDEELVRDVSMKDSRQQVGFARVVTDYASFAYLADVFILPSEQGNGLGTWLIEAIMDCPYIHGIRSFFLATRDAHDLYAKFGFEVPANPSKLMMKRYEIAWHNPEIAETHQL